MANKMEHEIETVICYHLQTTWGPLLDALTLDTSVFEEVVRFWHVGLGFRVMLKVMLTHIPNIPQYSASFVV